MKKLLCFALMLLLLSGCTREPGNTVAPEETAGILATDAAGETDPTEKPELTFLPGQNWDEIRRVGEDYFLLSGDVTTTVTRLSGKELTVLASAELTAWVSFSDPSLAISGEGMTYYDPGDGTLVYLSAELKEVRRVMLPENRMGQPVVSGNLEAFFCATPEGVYEFREDTPRLLREADDENLTPVALHCGDTVLECRVSDVSGKSRSLFLSTRDGSVIYETEQIWNLTTDAEHYFAVGVDVAYTEMLWGAIGQEPRELRPAGIPMGIWALMARNGVVLVFQNGTESITLSYYDMDSGLCRGALTFSGEPLPRSLCEGGDGEVVFLRYDPETLENRLYFWDPGASHTGDERSYLSRRTTFQEPDREGIARCEEIARTISQRHGVEILIWQDAVRVSPPQYALEGEYQPVLIEDALERLDQALSLYPSGFLTQVSRRTDTGMLRICLVRRITGLSGTGGLGQVTGITFQDENTGDVCVCLPADSTIGYTIHHELSHVMDPQIFDACDAYSDWNSLNPEGFTYDYDYQANQFRDGGNWTYGEDRAFVDIYAMSFPTEDRARILEYAMIDNCEEIFAAPIMQRKLERICRGIRQTYELPDSGEAFLWEQYLKETLE